MRWIPFLCVTCALALASFALTRRFNVKAARQGRTSELARTNTDPTAPDRFLPGDEMGETVVPRRGGKVVVHIESMPRSLNYLIENSGTTRRIQGEIHESLIERDFWTTEPKLVLAEKLVIEDTLVRTDGTHLYGRVSESGEHWEIAVNATEVKAGTDAPTETLRFAKTDVERVERETVFTFTLRNGVKWHDGQPLRVEDFLLSWRLTRNPMVECDEKRFEWAHIIGAERLDERRLRFVYDRQYFGARVAFESLIPLPAHRYDLLDPLNPDHDPKADERRQAEYVNAHPCNRNWIGLGPYRITQFTTEFIEAQRFEDYFDPEHAGWLDTIRWRFFANNRAAYSALLDGELDFTPRLSADDYFAAENEPRFNARFYRDHYYTPQMTFIGWNLQRPQFSDVRVRHALAHSFDWDEFVRTYYRGLAQRVTAEWYDGGLDYDASIVPIRFDLAAAERLFEEAGWIDRDGDGRIDKDGKPFEFRLLVQAGNPIGEALGAKFQENLKRVGVSLVLEPMEWGALTQRVLDRDFDAEFKAWVMPVESSPEQRWHSRYVGKGTANDTSFADPAVDALIELFLVELDPVKRGAIGRELHARLYAAQAYMYGVKVPHKFAINKRLRNVRFGPIDPGYRIRDWTFTE